MRGRIIFTTVVAAAGLATGLAAPAFADEADHIFLTVLEEQGIPFSTPENAVSLAGAVCEYVAAGQAPEQVAIEISGPANWSIEQSGFFVGAAVETYCPA